MEWGWVMVVDVENPIVSTACSAEGNGAQRDLDEAYELGFNSLFG